MIHLITALLLLQAQDPKAQEKVQERLEDQEERIKELEKKLSEVEKRQSATTSANPLTVLNPTLTVAGDFLWRFDDRKVFADNDPAEPRIDDTINVREVELDLRASVDPFVDGVAVLAIESEAPGEFAVAIEEFYATVKSLPLPLWETPPLGTLVRIGRFRTEFGLNNKAHTHDLPHSDRPLVIQEFLGPEGHSAVGVSTTSFLPSPGETALQLTLQLLNGGGIPIADFSNRLAYLANLNLYVPVAEGHSVNLALIGFYGTNDSLHRDQSRIVSADFLYKWKPARQGDYSSFLLGAQVIAGRHEFVSGTADDDGDGIDDTNLHGLARPVGYDVWTQYQFSARLYAGVRWDQTEFLTNDSRRHKQLSPYVTWYASEFFRARFTYQRTWSDDPARDGLDSFLVELVVIFGAHPPEPFWVNK
ncbi:MAG TPA: hypothetical protein VJB14_13715 [Planctomycetota bacterium]|nr:hypothetical protein [Planctomycetota bacterium]